MTSKCFNGEPNQDNYRPITNPPATALQHLPMALSLVLFLLLFFLLPSLHRVLLCIILSFLASREVEAELLGFLCSHQQRDLQLPTALSGLESCSVVWRSDKSSVHGGSGREMSCVLPPGLTGEQGGQPVFWRGGAGYTQSAPLRGKGGCWV